MENAMRANALKRRVSARYLLIQVLYWTTYCLMLNFAAVFLLDKGFSSGETGLVLGLTYLFSTCLQPLFGGIFSRTSLRLNICAAGIYILVAALSLAICLLPMDKAALGVTVVATFALQSMMQPTINSLSRSFEVKGIFLNFGLAKGISSAAFALTCLAVGQMLKRLSASILPCLYFATVSALVIALFCYRVPERGQERRAAKSDASYGELFRQYPHFLFFLLGATGLFITQLFIESFLVQILLSIGGNSSNVGTATMFSTMTELPALLLYTRFRRRKRDLRLLSLVGWLWALKDILTLLAPSPGVLYAVQMMHFATSAIYVPEMMNYVSRTLPSRLSICGVALAGTANTLGGLLGSILGGWLLDRMAVRPALLLMQVFSIGGALCLTVGVHRAQGRQVEFP